MNCPYCGARLQENARFCLYCMKPLQEKQPIRIRVRRKWLWLLPVLAALALLLLLFLPKRSETPRGTPTESAAPTATEAVPTTTEAVPATVQTAVSESAPVARPNSLMFDADQVTRELDAQALWDPMRMWCLSDEPLRYTAYVALSGAAMELWFLDEGLLVQLTDLTDDTLADGRRIAQCVTVAVCEGNGVLSPQTFGEALPVEWSVAEKLPVDDPAAARTDAGTTAAISRASCAVPLALTELWVTSEVRERTWEGAAHYDILLFFSWKPLQ